MHVDVAKPKKSITFCVPFRTLSLTFCDVLMPLCERHEAQLMFPAERESVYIEGAGEPEELEAERARANFKAIDLATDVFFSFR